MKRILLFVCVMLFFVGNAYAGEIVIPAGTRIEGVTVFGTFAPSEILNTASFPLAIKAVSNPLGLDGKEIPLKDCVVIGEVVADATVKRVFFKATRIVCSNAKEPGGILIKGYAIDQADNKLGILGVASRAVKGKPAKGKSAAPAASSAAGTSHSFIEIPPDAKVYLFILEAVSITVK